MALYKFYSYLLHQKLKQTVPMQEKHTKPPKLNI